MKQKDMKTIVLALTLPCFALAGACSGAGGDDLGRVQQASQSDDDDGGYDDDDGHGHHHKKKHAPGYNLNLEDTVRYTPLQPGADPTHGRQLFGVTADLLDSDPSQATFEGFSAAAGGPIVSNGRTCFSCHRGISHSFGMPAPPVSASVPSSDPLFTGLDADAQGDPRAAVLLEEHALFKIRPNRFNPQRSQDDPFRQVFFWRKSPALMNVAFNHGFLMDGRGRHMFETDRGAVFSHTQAEDERFDDLFPIPFGNDLEAFQKSLFTDGQLAALLDPNDPMHDTLVDDPFYTVPITTQKQARGKKVFEKFCFSCHNTPNVFSNLANVAELGGDNLDPHFPVHGPGTGRNFNIGVSERNKHNLAFTHDLGNGSFAPIVVPLANEDGSTLELTVDMDIGLAATTGRAADIGRFKVPQLRNIAQLGPYFHDNSADTLWEVIQYFDSPWYNDSPAGKRYPIHMSHKQKTELLAFLEVL